MRIFDKKIIRISIHKSRPGSNELRFLRMGLTHWYFFRNSSPHLLTFFFLLILHWFVVEGREAIFLFITLVFAGWYELGASGRLCSPLLLLSPLHPAAETETHPSAKGRNWGAHRRGSERAMSTPRCETSARTSDSKNPSEFPRQEAESWLPGTGERQKWTVTAHRHRGFLCGGDVGVLKLRWWWFLTCVP